jgi:hypothetical protein
MWGAGARYGSAGDDAMKRRQRKRPEPVSFRALWEQARLHQRGADVAQFLNPPGWVVIPSTPAGTALPAALEPRSPAEGGGKLKS